MKLVRRTTMLVLIILATSATLASASSSLSGEYVTTVKSAGELNGTYRISFSPGHFTLHAPYDIIGHGTYSISGSRITMHGPSAGCTSPAPTNSKSPAATCRSRRSTTSASARRS